MEAHNGNKVYQCDKQSMDSFAARGYDIYENGKLIKHAANKVVPIAQYEELLAKYEALLKGEKPEKKASKRPTKAELLAEAEELGLEVPEGATNPELYDLIQAAK